MKKHDGPGILHVCDGHTYRDYGGKQGRAVPIVRA